jgi:FkbM family methyltransferase
VLLVEPQPSCGARLATVAARVAGSEFVAAALSSEAGTVSFHLGGTNSYICNSIDGQSGISVASTTVDLVLADRPHFRPNLLKLDLQGFELEALRGATRAVDQFEVWILEVSILRIGDVPIFHEVLEFMENAGMRLYDVIPMYYRPLDGALWQADAFFVRRQSALIASREWERN